jgi:hypothetical protein
MTMRHLPTGIAILTIAVAACTSGGGTMTHQMVGNQDLAMCFVKVPSAGTQSYPLTLLCVHDR